MAECPFATRKRRDAAGLSVGDDAAEAPGGGIMATVGAMVAERANALVSPGARVEFPYGADASRAADALLIKTQAATIAAFRDLGLWDAEVLEGRVTDRQDCNGSYWVFETERGMWPDAYYDANVLGKHFRVIVLPVEEE